jgi:hypothetical protein
VIVGAEWPCPEPHGPDSYGITVAHGPGSVRRLLVEIDVHYQLWHPHLPLPVTATVTVRRAREPAG